MLSTVTWQGIGRGDQAMKDLMTDTLMDPTTGSLFRRGLKEMRSFPENVRSLTPTRIETKRATTRPNTSTGSPLWDRNLGSGYTTS